MTNNKKQKLNTKKNKMFIQDRIVRQYDDQDLLVLT